MAKANDKKAAKAKSFFDLDIQNVFHINNIIVEQNYAKQIRVIPTKE